MKLTATLIAVTDMDASVAFYHKVLGLRVTADYGANKTLSGGLSLQTRDSWRALLDGTEPVFGGCCGELYFEASDFDALMERLQAMPDLTLLHPVKTQPWGQRAIRFFDPDRHVVEVGEPLSAVCRRFLADGLTPEETARRMDVPLKLVRQAMKGETHDS